MEKQEKIERAMRSYRIVTAESTGEITEKKSRFIADVFPVRNIDEAEARLQEIRKKYWDARHHCYAFAIGSRRENTRCSDDGEPSGTAGKPILEVLNGAALTDTLIVVTRYFGGTLLGTGGLVRAYTQAAQAGLSAAAICEMVYGRKITVDIEYPRVGALQHYFRERGILPTDVRYTDRVAFDLNLITSDIEPVAAALTELTEGQLLICQGEEGYFPRAVED